MKILARCSRLCDPRKITTRKLIMEGSSEETKTMAKESFNGEQISIIESLVFH